MNTSNTSKSTIKKYTIKKYTIKKSIIKKYTLRILAILCLWPLIHIGYSVVDGLLSILKRKNGNPL